MNRNCIDYPCKFCMHKFDPTDDYYCLLNNEIVPNDIDQTGCKKFELARTCLDCRYSRITAYETGFIDDIEYRCPFQENKLVYDDLNVYVKHYADIPECNIDKFELIGEQNSIFIGDRS